MLKEISFELVFPSAWPSVFWHRQLKLLLAVYVEGFKMAGPSGNPVKGWELIGSKIDMDTPSPLSRYLGCEHVIKQNSRLGTVDRSLAHAFDKILRDPAACPRLVQDYAEYLEEEGVYVRHHRQRRKALNTISSRESPMIRCTEAAAVTGSEMPL